MGLFSKFSKEIAVDLGTANTVIIHNNKIIVDEPSIIAVEKATGKLVAYGYRAQQMHGKTHDNIATIRPLKDGVIADFNAAEMMIKEMIRNAFPKSIFNPTLRIVICIPSGSTEVEVRAVRDSSEHAGGREVYIIFEPMAAALGIGLDVESPNGHMVVDIGGGTSEIAVISLGGIVCNESINTAGDAFTEDIQSYMKQQHNIVIGERSAELIKMSVGAAVDNLENPPENYEIVGHNIINSKPHQVSVSYKEIAYALDKSLTKLDEAIVKILDKTPPELYRDIVKNGIYLTGGGALIKGLAERLKKKTNIEFIVAEDPLKCVARGTGIALKNIDKFLFLSK